MTGTPGGTARVAIQGVNDRIPLTETSRGVYEGSYVIRRKDKIRGDLVADAYLVSDRRETRQRLEHQTTQQVQQLGRVPVKPTVVACTNCGAVQSVNVVINFDLPLDTNKTTGLKFPRFDTFQHLSLIHI